jgi:formylglycine-generating enzyme required for sulfatase activity
MGIPAAWPGYKPIVWIDLEDARAFVPWTGKRIPTEIEWQYAAQSMESRAFPWGAKMEPGRCNIKLNNHPGL